MNHPFSPYVCRRPLFGTSSDPSKDFIELKMAMDREAGVLSKSIAFACPLLRRARGMKCGGSTPPLANLGYSVPEHLASLRPLISYPAWAPAGRGPSGHRRPRPWGGVGRRTGGRMRWIRLTGSNSDNIA